MREIKFRAWDTTNKKMRDRVLAGPGDPCSIVWDEERHEWVQFDDACGVIMQYTGVTDCNGLDIYDGDIVRITHTSLLIPANTIGVVSYASARYVIDTHAHTHGLNMFVDRRYRRYGKPHIEVIGNLHETPGLAPKK